MKTFTKDRDHIAVMFAVLFFIAIILITGAIWFAWRFIVRDPFALSWYAVVFLLAWVSRGLYQDNKDMILNNMGDIELSVLRGKIDELLEERHKKK